VDKISFKKAQEYKLYSKTAIFACIKIGYVSHATPLNTAFAKGLCRTFIISKRLDQAMRHSHGGSDFKDFS